MKAKLKDTRCTLSIGMIVKNEEKHLRDCLEALKPLREAVTSELIIVDTGSEDATVEIAKEYTDQVYSFEWINDFAAARNFGLDKATGKWFMYLDADEILVSPDELIDFFHSEKESRQYNTVLVVIHSFLDKERVRFSDFTATRIFRMNIGNRFHGTIHEVPNRIAPLKNLLQTRFDHYGYVFENQEERERKYQRNNQLLELELEKDPDNLRLICLYSASCPNEKRRGLLEHGRELARDQTEHYYFPEVYWRLTREYNRLGEYQRTIETADEYNGLTTQDHVGEVEISYNQGFAYSKTGKSEKMLEAYGRYMELYKRYEDGSLINQDNACTVCERAYPYLYNLTLMQMALALEQMERYGEAFARVTEIDFRETEQERDNLILPLLARIVCSTGEADMLVRAEEWIKKSQISNERKRLYYINIADIYLQRNFEISGESVVSGSFFSRLIHLEQTAEESQWKELLNDLSENAEEAEIYGGIMLYQALRRQKNPSSFLDSAAAEKIQTWNQRIAEKSMGLEKNLINYPLPKASSKDMMLHFWLIDLESRWINKCAEEYRLPLFRRIVEDFSWYANRLYSKDILTPEGVRVLPSSYRFAYWAGRALEAQKQGDTSGYIRFLGEASRTCPEMAEVVKTLVEEVRDNDEALKAQREQQELAQKIKGIVEGMILAGNKEDAQSILAQFELIAPNDPDIPALKAAILQQPTLSEI